MKYNRDQANIGNPKVNNVCTRVPDNLISAEVRLAVENSPGTSIQYIPLGDYDTEGFNAMKVTE